MSLMVGNGEVLHLLKIAIRSGFGITCYSEGYVRCVKVAGGCVLLICFCSTIMLLFLRVMSLLQYSSQMPCIIVDHYYFCL